MDTRERNFRKVKAAMGMELGSSPWSYDDPEISAQSLSLKKANATLGFMRRGMQSTGEAVDTLWVKSWVCLNSDGPGKALVEPGTEEQQESSELWAVSLARCLDQDFSACKIHSERS